MCLATSVEDSAAETEGRPSASPAENERAGEGENVGGKGRQKVTVANLAPSMVISYLCVMDYIIIYYSTHLFITKDTVS